MAIISRSRWGARHPDGFRDAPLPASEVWLHHSVTLAPDLEWVDADGDNVDDDEERAMRTLEDIGQSRFGGGISYTWLVMPSGRIYQGHSVGRQGAHTGGRNDIARAICLVGNYEDRAPTNAQLDSAAWLLRYAKSKGWIKYARLNGGHLDLKSTACPGAKAYAQIAEINRRAAAPIEEDTLSAAEVEKIMAKIEAEAKATRAYLKKMVYDPNITYTLTGPEHQEPDPDNPGETRPIVYKRSLRQVGLNTRIAVDRIEQQTKEDPA